MADIEGPVTEKVVEQATFEDHSIENKSEAQVKQENSLATSTNGNHAEEVNGKDSTVKVTEELKKKIYDQVHYYFGDYNLPRDRFLREEIKKDDGWIPMSTLLKFNRLASLSKDDELILTVLESSNLIEINKETKCIRRSPICPLPEYNEDIRSDTVKRTIYLKGFPKDGSINLDVLMEFFKPYGPVESIHMRHFYNKTKMRQGFKGSVLAVFPTVEKAQELYDLHDLKYKNTPLLTKFHANYLEEKKLEIQERIAVKEEKNKKRALEAQQNEKNKDDFPKGVYVHLSGVPEDIMREEIKEALSKVTEDVAFIDYNKGGSEGYLRLSTANSNESFVKETEGKIEVGGSKLAFRAVTGEEEDTQIKKAIEARNRFMGNKRRRGGGHGGGHHFKRRRV